MRELSSGGLLRIGALLLALLVTLSACRATGGDDPEPGAAGASSSRPSSESPGPAGARLHRLLGLVGVAEASYHAGYDRSCAPGHACVFGEEWTDDHAGLFGNNGCDTRQDVLLDQMRHIEMRWGSRCRIYEARLTDPYTGRRLTWRDDGYRIQVDHLYPLARAWHAGAWAWPQGRRVRFANDVRLELLAVSARANQRKGARSPADWLPPRRSYRCRYLVRYLVVARTYDLPITPSDAAVVRRYARSC